jgi:primase-polymerase (primpol)-like protein
MIEGKREHLWGVAYPPALFNCSQFPPLAMRMRPQWVCWRYELDGKWRKPPFHPLTGQKTDVTRPGRWATYEQALMLREGYHGLGYVFLPSEGYTRLDFDHCRDRGTGQIDQWVLEILSYLQTYSEVSPSGQGVHAVARGRLPGIDRKTDRLGEHGQGALEMYSAGQGYLTWTNERIDGYGDGIIRECDELANLYEIVFWEQLYRERVRPGRCPTELPVIITQTEPRTPQQEKADAWLLNRARNARNGQVFSKLYDELPGQGSQHEDDFRLCLLLLYWTQDRQGVPDLSWVDRLYRQSQRYLAGRWQKWDRKLGAYTYGQVTIYQAYMKRYIQS